MAFLLVFIFEVDELKLWCFLFFFLFIYLFIYLFFRNARPYLHVLLPLFYFIFPSATGYLLISLKKIAFWEWLKILKKLLWSALCDWYLKKEHVSKQNLFLSNAGPTRTGEGKPLKMYVFTVKHFTSWKIPKVEEKVTYRHSDFIEIT